MTDKPALEKRYAILWIPVSFHQHIQPLDCKKETNCDGDYYRDYRKYTEILNSSGEFVTDINGDIFLESVLISDKASTQVYLNLTLHKTTDAVCKTGQDTNGADKEASIPEINPYKPIEKRSVTISVDAYYNGEKKFSSDPLFLKCIDTSYNGLFQYEYEYNPDKGHFLLNSKFDIIHAVYHAIKGLYHRHKYHDHGADSIINPYCTDKKIPLRSPDNPALLHYLRLFENMFLADIDWLEEVENEIYPKYKGIKDSLNRIDVECDMLTKRIGGDDVEESESERELKELEKKRSGLFTELQKNLNIYREIDRKYAKVLGKQVFYHSLFYSKYNTLFRPINDHLHLEKKEIQYTHTLKGKHVNCQAEGFVNLSIVDSFSSEQKSAYKSAINIQNALTFAMLQKKEIENFINKENHYWNEILIRKTTSTTTSLKELTERSGEADKRANKFAFRSAVVAALITLVLGGLDCIYFTQSASKSQVVMLDSLLHKQQVEMDALHLVVNENNKLIKENTLPGATDPDGQL